MLMLRRHSRFLVHGLEDAEGVLCCIIAKEVGATNACTRRALGDGRPGLQRGADLVSGSDNLRKVKRLQQCTSEGR